MLKLCGRSKGSSSTRTASGGTGIRSTDSGSRPSFGQKIVKAGTLYTKEDIIGAAKKQGVEIRKGDVVLFNAGWHNILDGKDGINPDPEAWGGNITGLGKNGAE